MVEIAPVGMGVADRGVAVGVSMGTGHRRVVGVIVVTVIVTVEVVVGHGPVGVIVIVDHGRRDVLDQHRRQRHHQPEEGGHSSRQQQGGPEPVGRHQRQ